MNRKSNKILITGCAGFVGSHLAEFSLKQGCEVWGVVRPRTDLKNIAHIKKDLHLVQLDLMDAGAVSALFREHTFDKVFHLAAQSDVAYSFKNTESTLQNNIISELNILNAVVVFSKGTDVLIAGSSEEYGFARPEEFPLKESQPLRPLSPYAVSKVTQESLALQYERTYDLRVVVTRAFNHTGPRRGDNFAESSWAKQIVQGDTVKHGNLESYRDYTDVRDMVRAYWLAIERGKSGEVYNICSGTTHKMDDILTMIVKASGRKYFDRIQDQDRMRPSDVMYLLGDNTKFKVATGWKPEIPIEQTLKDLVNYWKKHV